MQQTTIAISGMTCGGCVSAVRKALGAVPGVHVDAVTVGSASVSYDVSRTTSGNLSGDP
jgi:copper chaperone